MESTDLGRGRRHSSGLGDADEALGDLGSMEREWSRLSCENNQLRQNLEETRRSRVSVSMDVSMCWAYLWFEKHVLGLPLVRDS
jgi:hypothetical protein